MSSWWLLDDPAAALPRVTVERADVDIVGAGITGISASLTLAEAGLRVRVRDARAHGGGRERSQRRVRAPRRRDAVRPGARVARSRRAAEYWRLTEDAPRRLAALAGDALRRTGSLRLAADAEERGGDPRRAARAARRRLRRRVVTTICSTAASRRRSSIRGTPRSSPRASCTASRHAPRARASRSSRALASSPLAELQAEQVVDRDGRLPERAARRVGRAHHPDARADDRDRADRGAPLRSSALRPARLRLLAADAGRPDPRGRLPRLRARLGVHRRRGDDADDPGARSSRSSPTSSGGQLTVAHRWAGIFGLVLDFLPVVGRFRTTNVRGSPAATRVTGTSSVSCAATSWRARCSATRDAARALRPGAIVAAP